MKSTSVTFLIIAIGLSAFSLQAQTRRRPHPVESITYEQVLDFLFEEAFVGRQNGYGIRLRYTPEHGNELQLTLMETGDGRTEVRIFMPLKESIRDQFYNYVERHPKASFQQLASKMQIKKEYLPFSVAEIRGLHDEILDVVGRSVKSERDTLPSPISAIFLHPDAYELWFYGGAHINLFGESPSDSPDVPFITWMKEKRPLIERWAALSRAGQNTKQKN
jgi:hypothetical protein